MKTSHRKPAYANCPHCGGRFAVTKRGRLRQHRNLNSGPGAPWSCPQTRKAEPAEPTEPSGEPR